MSPPRRSASPTTIGCGAAWRRSARVTRLAPVGSWIVATPMRDRRSSRSETRRAFSNRTDRLRATASPSRTHASRLRTDGLGILRFVFPGVKWRSGLSFRLAPNDHHGGRDASGPSYADHGRAACLNALPSTAFDTPSEGRRCACIGVRQCDEMLKSGDCKSDPRCDNGELGAIVCSCKAVRTSRYDSLRLTPLRGT